MVKKIQNRLWLDNGVVHYQSASCSWNFPLDDLLIFGEYTNQNGPVLDDYFFVFVTGPGMWKEASIYSDGRGEFLNGLGELLGTTFECRLVASTDFASNVLWPGDLVGQPLFEFTEEQTRGFWAAIGLGKMNITYSPKVLCWLQGLLPR